MVRNRLIASVAVCAICGSAFAGGLLANGTASDKAVVGGLLVAVAGMASAALAYFARRAAQSAEPAFALDRDR
jgi:hypothetical protein